MNLGYYRDAFANLPAEFEPTFTVDGKAVEWDTVNREDGFVGHTVDTGETPETETPETPETPENESPETTGHVTSPQFSDENS